MKLWMISSRSSKLISLNDYKKNPLPLLLFTPLPLSMTESLQYATYILPSRAPPSRLFGPVWTLLYILIAVSYAYVVHQVREKKLPKTFLIPFIINLIVNFSFTYIQFRLQNYRLAVADILIVLATIIRTMIILRPKIRRAFRLQVPYLLRVSFATILAINVAILN